MGKSENRRRTHLVALRLLPDEHARLTEAAAERQQSVSEVLRQVGLPTPRTDFECRTVGELISANFVHLLDRGELDTLRQVMAEAAEWLATVPLPAEGGVS